VSHARPVPLRVCSVFFFQAEDGIRDFHVTGVQTCALPILRNAPPAAAFMLLYARRRRRVAQALGELSLLERLGGRGLAAFPWRRVLLVVPAAAALGFATLGPRWGTRDEVTESRSANVVLTMDISKSMLAPDVAPDRLERARLLARRIVREMRTDRIGLVVFAGRAYVLSPLTTDHGALDLYLDALDPQIVSQGG